VLQIVVVDSGSFDGCCEMLEAEFSEVEFIQSLENIGFGRSNNLGFQHVNGDYLLLLNPDTELKPHAIATLMEAIQELPAAGLVSPRLINTDGLLQTSCVQSLPTPLNQALDCELLRRLFPSSRLWGNKAAFAASEPIEVEAVSGAAMLLRSDIFRLVGGFSAGFFMYGEDMDLCAKLRQRGLKIYHVPGATVVHHGGGSSSAQVSQFGTIMKRVAGEYYMRLNKGPAVSLLFRLLQGLSAFVRLSLLVLTNKIIHRQRRIQANASLQKWWYVLRWAMGASHKRY